MSLQFHRFLLAAAFSAFATACGDDGAPSPAPASSAHPPDEIGCEGDARAQTYERGLAVPGTLDQWTFVLETADPAPPAKGLNRWTVALRDGGGADAGAAVETLDVVPFMPDHNHGPARAPTVQREAGHFTVDDIDFFMPGLWRVTLTATGTAGEDTAEFFFCVEG